MSTACPRQARKTHHTALLALATTALTGLLTACTGTSSTLPPAPTTTSTTPANPSASLDAEKAKVIAAYHAYQQALVRLFAGGKADPKILEDTATPEAARELARQAGVLFSTGYRMVGTPVSTPRSVQIAGSTATLVTCIDDSRWVSVKAGSTPTPGQTGDGPGLARLQLARGEQGRWLVKNTEDAGKC